MTWRGDLNNGLQRVWKETVVAELELLSWNCVQELENVGQDIPLPGRDQQPGISEFDTQSADDLMVL
jgi:hypothetical protein